MRKIITLIFIFFSASLFAQKKIDKKCQASKAIAVTYLNGVLGDTEKSRRAKEHIGDLIENSPGSLVPGYTFSDYCYKYIYNQTAGIYDFIETLAQKIREGNPLLSENEIYQKAGRFLHSFEEAILTESYIPSEEITREIVEYIAGAEYETLHKQTTPIIAEDLKERSVLLISHSQGNLFANLIYGELKRDPALTDRMDRFANLQVASAAAHIAAKDGSFGDHLTAYQDLVIQGLGLLGSTLPPNVDIYNYFFQDLLGHSFIDVYTNPSVSGRLDGEPFIEMISQIFMDKVSALSKEILKPVCAEGINLVTFTSQADIPGGDHFLYPILEYLDGTPYQGDLDGFKLMAITENNDVLEVLNKTGHPIEFNKLSYIEENLADHMITKYILTNKAGTSRNTPEAAAQCPAAIKRSLVKFEAIDTTVTIEGLEYDRGSVQLNALTGDIVDSILYNGSPLELESRCYSHLCRYHNGANEISFPGTVSISLTSGQNLTFYLERPQVSSHPIEVLTEIVYGQLGARHWRFQTMIDPESIVTNFEGELRSTSGQGYLIRSHPNGQKFIYPRSTSSSEKCPAENWAYEERYFIVPFVGFVGDFFYPHFTYSELAQEFQSPCFQD